MWSMTTSTGCEEVQLTSPSHILPSALGGTTITSWCIECPGSGSGAEIPVFCATNILPCGFAAVGSDGVVAVALPFAVGAEEVLLLFGGAVIVVVELVLFCVLLVIVLLVIAVLLSLV